MAMKNIVAIAGNPNCGKTTMFNALTGSKQTVGNWPGVTVEKKYGNFKVKDRDITLVDIPGIYSVQPTSTSSEDERVARDYLLTGEAELVINIVDASNLERNLYMTTQLLEMQIPMLVIVNMLDVAKSHQIEIDLKALSEALDCPVVGTIASKSQVDEVKEAIDKQLIEKKIPRNPIVFPPDISESIKAIGADLARQGVEKSEWYAEQLMEGGKMAVSSYLQGKNLDSAELTIKTLDRKYDGDLDMAIADIRYSFVSDVANKAIIRHGEATQTLTDKIDKVVLHRWLGIPIFLLVMYFMFIFAINIGSAFIDFFDILFEGIFVTGFGELLEFFGAPDWLRTILANGIGGGIQCVSTFIPVITCLFLALSFLEDSGYMARAAFVMDRLMRTLGLPGKSFVPLIVGFGCGVPAIMATRTMERKSDRITTVLMAPFMSCGARLPVYVLFATAFWPMHGQNLVFSLYVIGIVVAILTGFILKRTALRGEASAFVMEIPPYHLPTIKNLLLRTWDRLKGFIIRAGKVIVGIVAVLGVLNSLGTDGTFGNEDTENSVLSQIGMTIVPAFKPMGITEENWPAAVGVFTGILAKEAVVGSLNSLYGGMSEGNEPEKADEEKEGEEAEEGFDIVATFKEAVGSIGEAFKDFGTFFTDPLGISVDNDLSDVEAQAEEQEVDAGTIGIMNKLFDGQLGAFAYLLMVLLYLPCGASMGSIYRETGVRWTLFAALWTTAVGYCSATIVYQIGRFDNNPAYATTCIVVCIAALIAIIVGLRMSGGKDQPEPVPQPVKGHA